MVFEMIKPSYERIKFLQNQLRTAIQNHHVLLLKSRVYPQDEELKSQMQILQSLIVSMGRTQNELLDQLDQEVARGLISGVDAARHLSLPIPKNIPVYEGSLNVSGLGIKTVIPVLPKVQPMKQYVNNKSLLRPSSESAYTPETVAKYQLKTEETMWKNKKLQSVLKTKQVFSSNATQNVNQTEPSQGFIKITNLEKGVKRIQIAYKELQEENNDSIKRRKSIDSSSLQVLPESKGITSHITSVSKPAASKKVFETSKTYTRSKRRQAVAAAKAAAFAASRGKLDIDIDMLEENLKKEPVDPDFQIDEQLLANWNVYEAMGKTKFFEQFNLISVDQRDAIRIKKCGRKRRTLAGQSSLYNDYLQPPSLSLKSGRLKNDISPPSTPLSAVKFVYGRGGSRLAREGVKRAVAAVSNSGDDSSTSNSVTSGPAASDSDTIFQSGEGGESSLAMEEAEAEAREMAAMEAEEASAHHDEINSSRSRVPSTDGDAVVIDAPLQDDQDDDDKPCVVCKASGCTESCMWCSEKYHTKCAATEEGGSKGVCPSCFNNSLSDVKVIVGEGKARVSSSTMELIERYLHNH